MNTAAAISLVLLKIMIFWLGKTRSNLSEILGPGLGWGTGRYYVFFYPESGSYTSTFPED